MSSAGCKALKKNFGWEFWNIFEAKSLTYTPEAKTLI